MSSTIDLVPDGDVMLVLYPSPLDHPGMTPCPHDLYCIQLGLRKPKPTRDPPLNREMRIRVSSTHLCYVSDYFKVMFECSFKEGTALHQDGFVEIPLHDDYPSTLLFLLKITYGTTENTPPLNPTSFGSIAILMDKYQFKTGCVKPYYKEWAADSEFVRKKGFPSMLLWICLSRLFGDEKNFEKYTRQIIIAASDRCITDLPIPERVLG